MDLGKAIYRLRKLKGIAQGEMAERAKISQAYLSLIENNRKEASMGTLTSIAEVLEVPLPVIFFLALDDKDVNPEKQALYEMFKPSMEGIVKKIFLENDERGKNGDDGEK